MPDKRKLVEAFLLSTSIRGVSAITRTKSMFIKVLWILGALMGLSIGFYLVIILLMEYFSYKVTVTIHDNSNDATFPDITLCPLNPLSNMLYLTVNPSKKIHDYLQKLNQLKMTIDPIYLETINRLEKPGNILLNLNDRDSLISQNNWINMTVDCTWFSEKVPINPESCKLSFLSKLYFSSYGYCETFQSPINEKSLTSFNIVLFMADYMEFITNEFVLTNSRPFGVGLHLTVHKSQSIPNLDEGVVIPVGGFSQIFVKEESRVKKGHPYSACQHVTNFSDICHFEKELSTYNKQICQDCHAQQHIMADCGCVNNDIISTSAQRGDLLFCDQMALVDTQSMENEVKQIKARRDCVSKSLERHNSDQTTCYCPDPCKDDYYTIVNTNVVEWPHETDQISVYNKYVKNKLYKEYIFNYTILEKFSKTNVKQTIDILKNISSLKKHFALVQVSFMKDTVKKYQDEPSISVTSMIGNLGGNLNLWVGLTLFTVIEFAEFLYRLVKNSTKSADTREAGNPPASVNLQTIHSYKHPDILSTYL